MAVLYHSCYMLHSGKAQLQNVPPQYSLLSCCQRCCQAVVARAAVAGLQQPAYTTCAAVPADEVRSNISSTGSGSSNSGSESSSSRRPEGVLPVNGNSGGSSSRMRRAESVLPAQDGLSPQALTIKLQQAQSVQQLQQLWECNCQQFNTYHYSAVMQQLATLHQAVASGIMLAGGKQQRAASQAQLGQVAHLLLSGHSNSEVQAQVQQLARRVAAAALSVGTRQGLDLRCLVMMSVNLVKVGVFDQQLHAPLRDSLGPQVLPQLDAQQLTNLIWAVGTCAASGAVGANGSSMAPGKRGIYSTASTQQTSSSGSSSGSSISWRAKQPMPWLHAAAGQLRVMLPCCSDAGVAMAVWGFAQAGFNPGAAWWEAFWVATQPVLQSYSAQNLALLACALGKLQVQVPSRWLSSYCTAACDVMSGMSTQQLTMCLWGLACCNAKPHKAFTLLWFLTSMGAMQRAATQELSMWMYSLALLHITPSPTWCASYVEASYERLTAAQTSPQDLVTAMWAISNMSWSPPLLYWRGLLEASLSKMPYCGPQDLANCISAAAYVDVSCISPSWLKAFIKASEPLLSAFLPVQLAHTINALAMIARQQQATHRIVTAAWQQAFVHAALLQLQNGRFNARNLSMVMAAMRALQFEGGEALVQFYAVASAALTASKPQQ